MLQEAEAAALAKEVKRAKQADKVAQAAQQQSDVVKSPSGSSCLSYELFVGQAKGNDDNKRENMSIRSEGGDSVSEHRGRIAGANGSTVRKVSAVSVGNITISLSVCMSVFGVL
jgi:voltage-gated sodium channel type II alpha